MRTLGFALLLVILTAGCGGGGGGGSNQPNPWAGEYEGEVWGYYAYAKIDSAGSITGFRDSQIGICTWTGSISYSGKFKLHVAKLGVTHEGQATIRDGIKVLVFDKGRSGTDVLVAR